MFAPPFDIPPPPGCHATGCTADSLVHWRRRLLPAEIETALAEEQGRRQSVMADHGHPSLDVFGPMPDGSQFTHLVHACGQHAIGIDAAALIHQAQCSGPDSPALPACDCAPEPPPPAPAPPAQELPVHWASAT